MKQYTIEELNTEPNAVVFIDNEKNYKRLESLGLHLTSGYFGPHCYMPYDRTFCSNSTRTFVAEHRTKDGTLPEIITPDQVLGFEEEFVLPEKWCVQDCKEVSTWAAKIFNCGVPRTWEGSKQMLCINQITYPLYECYYFRDIKECNDYTEITFEQFKKYVMKTEEPKKMEKPYTDVEEVDYKMITTHPYFKTLSLEELANVIGYMKYEGYEKLEGEYSIHKAKILFNKFNQGKMEKKLIGYNIKPEFESKVNIIAETLKTHTGKTSEGVFLPNFGAVLEAAKELNVLDLWFDPVYEESFKPGDWVVIEYYKFESSFYKECDVYSRKLPEKVALRVESLSDNGMSSKKDMFLTFKNYSYEHPIDCFRKATSKEIEESLIPQIIIKGYKAKFTKDSVSFGGQTYSKEFIKTLSTMLDVNNFNFDYKKEVREMNEHFQK